MRKTIVGVFACFGLLVFGCQRPMVAPQLRPDIGPGKAFTYLRPDGWKGSGKIEVGGNSGAIELTQGTATVKIGADLTGSLQGDIMAASNSQIDSMAGAMPAGMGAALRAANKPAVERLHEAQGTAFSRKFENFTEGKMVPLNSKLGEGRYTEYTGDIDGLDVHGYRVTILGGDKRYTIRTQCWSKDWNTLRPVYEKIIQSVGPGPQN